MLETKFGIKMNSMIEGINYHAKQLDFNMKEITTKLKETCNKYLIANNDEKREACQKLFAFFAEYFEKVHTTIQAYKAKEEIIK